MCVRIIPPTEDSRVRNIVRKEIAEPVDSICGRPSLLTVSIQPMDSDNTEGNIRTRMGAAETSLLDDGVDTLCNNLQPLRDHVHSRFSCGGRAFRLP